MERFLLIFLLVAISIGCNKSGTGKEEDYLNLQIDGEENAIPWQTFTSSWDPGAGTIQMEGKGYQYRTAILDLTNVRSTGRINITSLDQLYYADGVHFVPDSVSGDILIIEMNAKQIRGIVSAYFADNLRNESVHVTGEFSCYQVE